MFATATANDYRQVTVPKGFRAHVVKRARELYGLADGREISAVIAQETGRDEVVIDWILVAHALGMEAAHETLIGAIHGGMVEAKEAVNDVEGEPCRMKVRTRKQASRARCA